MIFPEILLLNTKSFLLYKMQLWVEISSNVFPDTLKSIKSLKFHNHNI